MTDLHSSFIYTNLKIEQNGADGVRVTQTRIRFKGAWGGEAGIIVEGGVEEGGKGRRAGRGGGL